MKFMKQQQEELLRWQLADLERIKSFKKDINEEANLYRNATIIGWILITIFFVLIVVAIL